MVVKCSLRLVCVYEAQEQCVMTIYMCVFTAVDVVNMDISALLFRSR